MAVAEQLQVEHKQAVVNGVRLHYVEAGRRPAGRAAARLPGVLVVVAPPDPGAGRGGLSRGRAGPARLRGSPRSRSAWRDYRIELLAADVAALIREARRGARVRRRPRLGRGGRVDGRDAAPGASSSGSRSSTCRTRTRCCARCMRNAQAAAAQLVHVLLPAPVAARAAAAAGAGATRSRAPTATRGRARSPTPTSTATSRRCTGPRASAGPINWYRAALRTPPRRAQALYRPIPAEVLVIWGEQDRFLMASMAQPSPRAGPARAGRAAAGRHPLGPARRARARERAADRVLRRRGVARTQQSDP